MLKHLKTYLEHGNRFCGIEHTVQSGKDVIHATILKKSKNTLDIENTFKETSLENIFTKLPKKQPVFLVINNENVLTKHIENKQDELTRLVYNAFPNINLEEFLYEAITQGNNHSIAICRKTYVEELITKYKENDCFVINLSLGNNMVSSIAHFLNTDTIVTSNANLILENNGMISIEENQTENNIAYDINGLQVNSDLILSFSGALDGLLQNFNPKTNFDAFKYALKKDFKQSRFYSQFLKFGLIFILGILLINLFIF